MRKINNYDNKKFKNHIATKIIKHMICTIMQNANSMRVPCGTFMYSWTMMAYISYRKI